MYVAGQSLQIVYVSRLLLHLAKDYIGLRFPVARDLDILDSDLHDRDSQNAGLRVNTDFLCHKGQVTLLLVVGFDGFYILLAEGVGVQDAAG